MLSNGKLNSIATELFMLDDVRLNITHFCC